MGVSILHDEYRQLDGGLVVALFYVEAFGLPAEIAAVVAGIG